MSTNLRKLAEELAHGARTSAMSAMYHEEVSSRAKFRGRVVDSVVALGATGSTSIAASKYVDLTWLWVILGSSAALISILRPIWFQFDATIKRASSLERMWCELREDFFELNRKLLIRTATPDLITRADVLFARLAKAQKEDVSPERTLLNECFERVKVQFPPSQFWGLGETSAATLVGAAAAGAGIEAHSPSTATAVSTEGSPPIEDPDAHSAGDAEAAAEKEAAEASKPQKARKRRT